MSGYLVHERGKYEPPGCPGCEQPHCVHWVETTTIAEIQRGEQWFLPGKTHCATAGCAYNPMEQAR